MTTDWLIAGGGVGGLTLAVTLARCELSFLVLEKDAAADVGAGLLLAPNATTILKELGLLDASLKKGHRTEFWSLLGQSGGILREIPTEPSGPPALSVHRADLLALLRANIPTASLRNGMSVAGIKIANDGVTLSLADGSTVSGRALIGADGMRSVVRQQTFPDKPLRYRGYVGWRGIAPFVPQGYERGVLRESWGQGGRFGIAPVGGLLRRSICGIPGAPHGPGPFDSKTIEDDGMDCSDGKSGGPGQYGI